MSSMFAYIICSWFKIRNSCQSVIRIRLRQLSDSDIVLRILVKSSIFNLPVSSNFQTSFNRVLIIRFNPAQQIRFASLSANPNETYYFLDVILQSPSIKILMSRLDTKSSECRRAKCSILSRHTNFLWKSSDPKFVKQTCAIKCINNLGSCLFM